MLRAGVVLSPQLALQIGEAFDDLILRVVLSIFDDAPTADDRIAHGGACEREDDGGQEIVCARSGDGEIV